ncbi:tyrosine-type recombinase/integrase [Paraburkholderia sp. SIMBA_009]
MIVGLKEPYFDAPFVITGSQMVMKNRRNAALTSPHLTSPCPLVRESKIRLGVIRTPIQYISSMSKSDNHWLSSPTEVFRRWQELDATGAAGRAFSARSIVQHTAMFERFLRFLVVHETNLASFGEDHFAAFLEDLGGRCRAETSTALRYTKLVDRLCRHLIDVGLRAENPAAVRARLSAWPTREPVPGYLDECVDLRLQTALQDAPGADTRTIRNRAAVALLLVTGVTSAEIRRARREDVLVEAARLRLVVCAHAARAERVIPVAAFADAAMDAWLRCRAAPDDELLFPLRGPTGSLSDETLWRAVRDALDAQGFEGDDKSPRVLRNTFARRLLIAGKTNEEVSCLMGLASQRTVVRLRATLTVPSERSTSSLAP